MSITFENNNDIIVYALEKIISSARENQYIFLAQSIWWISSIIGLQQGLVTYIDNLKKGSDVTIRGVSKQHDGLVWCPRIVSPMPRDIQEELPPRSESGNIHPDRLPQIDNTTHDKSDLVESCQEPQSQVVSSDVSDPNLGRSESEQLPRIITEMEQFLVKSRKERKAFNKQILIDSLPRTRSGKVIIKPLSNKQRSYLLSIPKDMINAYLANRK